jgi:hypothetical protein
VAAADFRGWPIWSSGLRVAETTCGETEAYRAVVSILVWPNKAWMTRRSVPFSSR